MTTGRIGIGDGELSYEVRGAGSPVVLLHGGGLDSRMWDGQLALLERHHTVVRYDARGYGRSSTPTGRFAHYEDLRRLLEGLGISRACLVGLSLGARTAIDVALAHPALVDRLFLASPGISGMGFRDPFNLGQFEALAAAAAAGDLVRGAECVLRLWVDGPRRAPEDVDQGVRELCRQLVVDTVTRHGGADPALVVEVGAVDRVGELGAPTLVLVGGLDSSDIHDVADLLDRRAPRARKIVVPGAAHLVNLEQPEAFNRALLQFLGPAGLDRDVDPADAEPDDPDPVDDAHVVRPARKPARRRTSLDGDLDEPGVPADDTDLGRRGPPTRRGTGGVGR